MRILILSNLYPPNVVGGYERLCFEVTAGLAASGHEMVVLTSNYGGKVTNYPSQRVLRELNLLTGPDIYTPFPGTEEDRMVINQSNLGTLHRTLEKVLPDVVFAWNLFFLDASMLQTLEQSCFRTVVMLTDNWLLVMRNGVFMHNYFQQVVHGTKPFEPPPPPVAQGGVRLWLRALLGRPPKTGLEAIFGSAFMRDLYAAGGSIFERHQVIHNGVKQTHVAGTPKLDRTWFVELNTLHLLFAGRLVDLKGAHIAVAAMSQLDPVSLGVARIQLTLLGDAQNAAYMGQLEAGIAQSGQAANIVLRPSVPEDQLSALFNGHDIYLFPSLYEPFSLTLIHALSFGIPTIASDIGGNVEIVRDRESGLLFKKGDLADLAAVVRFLATDGALRARLADGGRCSAARFTFEQMIAAMEDFLAQQKR